MDRRTATFVSVLGATVISFVLGLSRSAAAEFKSFTSKEGKVLISIAGDIAVGDTDKFKEQIRLANDARKYVANVRLNSPGGNLLEGVKLAQTVRYAQIATNVGKSGVCASACFLVFAAGNTKFANYTARIGVHGASTNNGEEAGEATVVMGRVAKELGVPSAIIGRMVITPPSEMVWLTPAELQSMGTTMVGKPAQISAPVDQAGGPMQLSPAQVEPKSQASLTPDQKWKNIVDAAVAISRGQNNGVPRFSRACDPRTKSCSTGILYKDNGADVLVVKREDVNGRVLEREVCTFNSYNDIRGCYNIDTGTSHKDMKSPNGDWSAVN